MRAVCFTMAAQPHFRVPHSSPQLANANVMRSSAGVGLSWASPFGALTVNYALPMTKAAYDLVKPFGFSAGPFCNG